MESDPDNALAMSPEFISVLGFFHSAFASLNLIMDWSIGHFMQIPDEQVHLITAGLMFGPKARILADLIGRSNHPKRSELLGVLNKIRGNSKRDVIAHGYIWSSETEVRFIERIASGEFKVKAHSFTYDQFFKHVNEFSKLSTQFYDLLGLERSKIGAFADAAFNLARKSKTSPQKPDESAS